MTESARRTHRRRQEERSEDFGRAQLLWTFFVAIAVAIAALYRLYNPTSSLMQTAISGDRSPSAEVYRSSEALR